MWEAWFLPGSTRVQMSKHHNKKIYLIGSHIFIATVSLNFRVFELRWKQALPAFSEKIWIHYCSKVGKDNVPQHGL